VASASSCCSSSCLGGEVIKLVPLYSVLSALLGSWKLLQLETVPEAFSIYGFTIHVCFKTHNQT
jgi:hypothetical protein